ncbi:MAG: XRE family transcriptional regulator [Proteobacteria bacterium]|nr:XRE family transcriptional regulator [Pseudomonadota bacterium]MBU1451825.1 XRE family transcriptional regulator [Pseudomonadota bacterium]MBU2470503.1 XRE family transcriptional regulator [Pseudomonadota bacterium]
MDIGDRLKKFRTAKGLTMKKLAEAAGVSEPYISQLEKGSANPSLGTLKKIAEALDQNIVAFFSVEDGEQDVVCPLEERREIVYPGGHIRAQLMVSKLNGKTIEPLYTIIEPGGDTLDPYIHTEGGEEFGVLIKGQLLLTIDGVEHHLKKGDAFYFRSDRPHRWANPGKDTTEIVWVITPPTF